MDAEKRASIIRSALMEKAGQGQGLSMFTADDILTVAGITAQEVEAFNRQIEQAADLLSRKAGE